MLLGMGWRRQGGEVGFRLWEDRDLGRFSWTTLFPDFSFGFVEVLFIVMWPTCHSHMDFNTYLLYTEMEQRADRAARPAFSSPLHLT